jgi:hypothetical protein
MGQALVLAGQTITPSVLNRIYGTGDTTQHTVNGATLSGLSTIYSIPAGDASAGTAYRITVFGTGEWGSTAQALTFAVALADTAIGQEPVIASSALSTSAVFAFDVTALLICVSSGSSGTWVARVAGTVTQTANAIVPGTAADNTIPFTGVTTSAAAQNTTVANDFAIMAKWASTTGTPTLTCMGTLFEKVN